MYRAANVESGWCRVLNQFVNENGIHEACELKIAGRPIYHTKVNVGMYKCGMMVTCFACSLKNCLVKLHDYKLHVTFPTRFFENIVPTIIFKWTYKLHVTFLTSSNIVSTITWHYKLHVTFPTNLKHRFGATNCSPDGNDVIWNWDESSSPKFKC